MQETRIAVLGCGGRMGRRLLAVTLQSDGCRLVGGSVRSESPLLGQDLGRLAGHGDIGVESSANTREVLADCEVAIDFTTPEATAQHAAMAAETGTALVVGTTGMTDDDLAALQQAAERIPVVYGRNMSLGVNLLALLVEQAARALDASYDIEIVEMHHRHKVDAPSGTALLLGEAAAAGRSVALAEVERQGRSGITGSRPAGEIGFASLRGGDVPGDHSVILAGDGERIELGHRASNRDVFALGAVKAARWVKGRPAGLYGMLDVLGLGAAQQA
ncbi:4-hydroxy-tetrahydrodipicolinate reductase [Aquibaculum arenosum]|uniref:4-hydroxy-tetrahydrodipicolinate reductase n=1 Tax=Aquibaculum arenosum TaxID=3032591 RepID=A0ABT5YJT8_9PROT|nr:4-hydroxy-tetrahydrodipicolinate reductase [Fodinicurvata sp. CAU 1616]MDF2095210.1 4-hydroxy-tetrahydrodipicolinate reductase [Fodinicurvata sp. CAU 1616]